MSFNREGHRAVGSTGRNAKGWGLSVLFDIAKSAAAATSERDQADARRHRPRNATSQSVEGAGLHHNPTPGLKQPVVPLWSRGTDLGLGSRTPQVGNDLTADASGVVCAAEGHGEDPAGTEMGSSAPRSSKPWS